jgi:integrase
LVPTTRLALRRLLLTGQREAEVCGMERSEVDLRDRLWTIPGTRVKNKMTHTPLSDEAVAKDVIDKIRTFRNMIHPARALKKSFNPRAFTKEHFQELTEIYDSVMHSLLYYL